MRGRSSWQTERGSWGSWENGRVLWSSQRLSACAQYTWCDDRAKFVRETVSWSSWATEYTTKTPPHSEQNISSLSRTARNALSRTHAHSALYFSVCCCGWVCVTTCVCVSMCVCVCVADVSVSSCIPDTQKRRKGAGWNALEIRPIFWKATYVPTWWCAGFDFRVVLRMNALICDTHKNRSDPIEIRAVFRDIANPLDGVVVWFFVDFEKSNVQPWGCEHGYLILHAYRWSCVCFRVRV